MKEKKIKAVRLLKDLPNHKHGLYPYDKYSNIFNTYSYIDFIKNPDFFQIEYEPERKKIVVEVKSDTVVTAKDIQESLQDNWTSHNFKVTELNQFDILDEFYKYWCRALKETSIEEVLEDFKQEKLDLLVTIIILIYIQNQEIQILN